MEVHHHPDCCVKFHFSWMLGWFSQCVLLSLLMLLNVFSHGLPSLSFPFQFISDQPETLDIYSCFNASMFYPVDCCHQWINTLLQQKSEQMGNNLAEQLVNNNNKAKTKLKQTTDTRTTLFTTFPSSKDL